MVKAMLKSGDLKSRLAGFRPDIVYMRQMIWFPGLARALRGFRVVQEVNSDMAEELKLLPGMSGFLKRVVYSATKGVLERLASGVVFVTGELSKRSRFLGRAKVVSNGYVFDSGAALERDLSAKRPSLIFVGSPGQAWHGVDKVVQMAEALPEFDFHLVVPGLKVGGPANLVCHGQVLGEQLAELYRKTDVAIGSLALHRNSMDEACPLKCREYAANGLPIIAAYRDTDLSGASFFLELENNERNVLDSIPRIKDFVLAWRLRPFPYDEAVRRLDAVNKERERLAFFNEIVRDGA